MNVKLLFITRWNDEMAGKELVSIITPVYNSEKYITETIESVLSQTYNNWEMIIVDDCSTDNSQSVVKGYRKHDNRIYIYELSENRGQAYARNYAIEKANGRYIAFLDSDDLWLPDKLEKQIRFIQEKDAVLSYTAYKKMYEDGNIIESTQINVPEKVTYNDLLSSCVIGCLTAIYDCQKIGKMYMPNISTQEDYALWLKILKKGFIAYGLNEPLAVYRVRYNSISSNKVKTAKNQWYVYRNCENLSLIKSAYHFLHYAYYGFKKCNK